ncbi:unnamed protein product [Notodromas monacha]|uniref:Homeobox domain-containing protein n=1 Tax=Notodromas monacha TaxID=399045 RepID=A0A7R9BMG7_9CRUS|nr:unnamed protein product [Notodromas monacha]CAG0918225.1 unnamed protein product [Notodromas monacha]
MATLEKLFDGSGDLKAVPLVSEETRCGLERWLAQQVRQLATTSHNNNKGPVGGNVSPDCGGGPSGHCGPSTAEVHLAPCATVSAAQPPHPPPPAATSTIVLPPPQQQQLPPPAPAPPIPPPPPLPLRLNTPHLWHHPSPMFRPLVPNGAHDGHFEIKSEGMHRVRVRTSFDSELELPKLQHWFAENPHPSKQQIQDYVRILNAQESRRGRKQLDVTNVMYWFKNARAAHKRAEIRHQQLHQTSPMQHRSLGYSSSSEMSLSERGMKEDGEDAEEDDDDELDLTDFDDDDEDDNEVATEKSDGRADDEETEAQQAVFPGTGDASPRGFHQEYMQRFGFHPAHHHPAFMSPRISAAAAAALMTNPYVQHSLANISGLDLSCREGFSEVSQPASEERKKRNRTFIDPITEVPRLEQWFSGNSHPPHSMILRFTQELNAMPYRQKFPKLEAKNVQFWFKNRRAKCKRMKMSLTMP